MLKSVNNMRRLGQGAGSHSGAKADDKDQVAIVEDVHVVKKME